MTDLLLNSTEHQWH